MKIVLVGDSITFGNSSYNYNASWAGRLENYLSENYKDKFEVINTASEGETASAGLKRIEDSVIKYTPDIVFVGYGTNDCTKEQGKYKNDFYNFESNIEDMAKIIRDQTNATIIFNLAPPVIEELCNDGNTNIHNRDISAYNDVVKRICGFMNIPFIDHFQIMTGREDLKDLIEKDGIHPNDRGHQIMFDSILGAAGHFFNE